MIEFLYNKHKGCSVAIIGSSPSAKLFVPDSCDISIAINGAALLSLQKINTKKNSIVMDFFKNIIFNKEYLNQKNNLRSENQEPFLFDYFICGDVNAPKRSWFAVLCSHTRIIFKRIAPLDYFLYPKNKFSIKRRIFSYRRLKREPLPAPVWPHITFDYSFDETAFFKGERKYNKLTAGGTTASMAVQLAFLMGCSKIRLYGCSFSTQTSKTKNHYFFNEKRSHIGWLTPEQIQQMDRVLRVVRQHDVIVEVVGKTALKEFDFQLEE